MSKIDTRSDGAYSVGYRRPPKNHQFRRGRSGNPRGRTRGDENLISVFKDYVSRRIKVKIGDEARSVTVAEAVFLKNYNAALQGNSNALANLFRLAEQFGEFVDRTDSKQVGRPIAVPIRAKNTEEFLAAFGRRPGT